MNKRKFVLTLILLILIGLTAYYLSQYDLGKLKILLTQNQISPIFFLIWFVVGTVVMVPGWLLLTSGGLAFGAVFGVIYTSIGMMIGPPIAFVIARYLAFDWVEKITQEKQLDIIHQTKHSAWKYLAISRLIPAFPYNLLNYGFGITRIKFLTFWLLTPLFMLPVNIALSYFGAQVRDSLINEGEIKSMLLVASGVFIFLFASALYYKRLKDKLTNKRVFKG
jgi:uncharacterized membrane protein YdjX (TVP38/TMEM64 family)